MVEVSIEKGQLCVRRLAFRMNERIQQAGFRWWQGGKAWVCPASPAALSDLAKVVPPREWKTRPSFRVQKKRLDMAAAAIRARYRIADRIKTGYIPPNIDMQYLTDPNPHQITTLFFCLALQRAAVFSEQGTGKTKTFVDLFRYYRFLGKARNLLFVCPKTGITNIGAEFKKHGNIKTVNLDSADADRNERIRWLSGEHDSVVVTSYDLIFHTFSKPVKKKQKGRRRTQPDKKLIKLNFAFDMVVLDESHHIKSHRSVRAKIFHAFAESIRFKFVSTGTPVGNRGMLDLWSQLRFLSPALLGPTYFAYLSRYFENKNPHFPDWRLRKDQAERLHTIISKNSIRFEAAEVGGIPEIKNEVIRVKMTGEQAGRYDALTEELVKANVQEGMIPIHLWGRLHQIASGFEYTDEIDEKTGRECRGTYYYAPNPKDKALWKLLAKDQVGRAVVFYRFLANMRNVREAVRRAGRPEFVITADMRSADERGQVVERFLQTRGGVLISQVTLCRESINLQGADMVVYYSNDFSIITRDQSMRRVARFGDDTPTKLCVDLVFEDSLDESIIRYFDMLMGLSEVVTKPNLTAEDIRALLRPRRVLGA